MKKTAAPATTYPVSDLYLTAFLLCCGMKLIRTERVTQNRVVFVLKDSERRLELMRNFYGHRAKVDPLAYKDAIVNLKSLIHGFSNSEVQKNES